ncbi:MAG: hypothetical protein HC831_16815 [Chloroflexia bacterium]|nr:hypothetical protein [Chloroflexia bacterium]
MYNASSIKIYVPEKLRDRMNFKLYEKSSDSLIWETLNFSERPDLSEVNLTEGASYYWRLYSGVDLMKGEFELLSKEKIQNLEINKLLSISDYLGTFFKFLENDCKFDAMAILSEAIDKYPECMIFRNIANKIPIDLN